MHRGSFGNTAREIRIAAHETHASEVDLGFTMQWMQLHCLFESALCFVQPIELSERDAAIEGHFETGEAERLGAIERLYRFLGAIHPVEHGSQVVMRLGLVRRHLDRAPI